VPDAITGHLYSLLTAMFLHGGWMHLLGNMLFLWVFGRNVEDLIGSGGLSCFIWWWVDLGHCADRREPLFADSDIGASGAIAGVMARTDQFPRTRIVTLVPIIVFITTMEIRRR